MTQNLRQLFQLGERVKVSSEGGWRESFFGTILSGPESIQTRQGEGFFYWVEFDQPQHDLSEDGPYSMAQILSPYLEKISETP